MNTVLAPQLTWAMIKTIDFQGDPHLAIKMLNETIADKFMSDQGKCPHRPTSDKVIMSGDMSWKANGSFCVYCSQEIEMERIVWRAKKQLPTAPRSA